ncbi:YdcF family protein [Tateyamaria omphalii]|uniref:YdcF family protein n=1 Tax=Tateyamaria omphalii TaxID=299262 RepID=UPI001C995E72|nr:YdcF family protein [Tateyamaria omphalii]MBY5932050.1 YdcF family protein [Tateyamaria omphalii]
MEVREAALILWEFHCVYDDLSPADAIVGLGSYDLRVAERCADLFHQGYAERIVFTGAVGNWTDTLFQASEAEAFGEAAVAAGVPDEAIVLETHATNIGENVCFSEQLLPSARRVILVTKPQTQMRCHATVRKQWPGVQALVTAPLTPFEDQPLPHHDARALICEMVGDVERMGAYAKQGFQIEVEVPDAVRRACDVLVDTGFVDHLPKGARG